MPESSVGQEREILRFKREKAREGDKAHWDLPRPAALPHRPPVAIFYPFHLMMAILMVGFNVAVKLFFKSFRDEETLQELEHQNLQTELQYLKFQINPHFFMNTLNNIHALVDIDKGQAKHTIVELSKLMRYVLYEAGNRTVPLEREVQFLQNYITLMSLRYNNKVEIKTDFPSETEMPDVQVPPLLFVSFVENAFKHGVSYRRHSFIHIGLQQEEAGWLTFRCKNSNNSKPNTPHHGIGLENVRKRLRLLYGNDYTLSITQDEKQFYVLLIIPLS